MKTIFLLIVTLSTILLSKNIIVDQKNKTFIPHTIHAKIGDTLTFKNSDKDISHNAYSEDNPNAFDIGMQGYGKDKIVIMKASGKFDVECAIHPNMLLKVEVTK